MITSKDRSTAASRDQIEFSSIDFELLQTHLNDQLNSYITNRRNIKFGQDFASSFECKGAIFNASNRGVAAKENLVKAIQSDQPINPILYSALEGKKLREAIERAYNKAKAINDDNDDNPKWPEYKDAESLLNQINESRQPIPASHSVAQPPNKQS